MKYMLATVAALGISFSAHAQILDFAAIDVDQSGTITLEELQVAVPDVTVEQFTAADADGSGDLTPEELATIIGG